MIDLEPGHCDLTTLQSIYLDRKNVRLSDELRAKLNISQVRIDEAANGSEPVYGVNTGFGKLAHVKINPEDTTQLQRNLILSHCCGVGEPLEPDTVRLMMVLKLLSLGRGASGVKWQTTTQISDMLACEITPIIPEQGSVGASGDLAPLAHMAACLIGEGEVLFKEERMPTGKALQKTGMVPIELGPKEGLALINGTQFSTACALVGLWAAQHNLFNAIITASMTTDAIMGSTAPFHPEIHELRGHPGQIQVAHAQRRLLQGSEIRENHRENDTRVQDPYCVRCNPQVTGAAMDLLGFVQQTLKIEANAVTDNPIVLVDDNRIVSGGNFHAEPVAFAADQIAIAISEIGAISQRRIALMVDPTLSFDLPPFLTPEPGLNSGLMIAEVTSAALMSENKHLANPCSTDSTPTSANQEDHVSMAAHAARRLARMNKNLTMILGIEAICAAQGIEMRAPLKASPDIEKVIAVLRRHVPSLTKDRYLAPDLELAAHLIHKGELVDAVDLGSLWKR